MGGNRTVWSKLKNEKRAIKINAKKTINKWQIVKSTMCRVIIERIWHRNIKRNK